MKVFVVLSALLAVASASPLLLAPAQVILPSASTQYHSQDGLGGYAFGYNDPLSAKQEVKTLDGVTRGTYSYMDSNGVLQNVMYTADAAGGFRVTATNLPKPVEIPTVPSPELPKQVEDSMEVAVAKAAHFAAIEEAKRMNGVITPIELPKQVEDTPEVAKAKAEHFAAIEEAKNMNDVVDAIELPKPVEDTPEVAKAKAEHFQAIEEAKLRNSGIQKIDNGVTLIPSPPLVAPYSLVYKAQPLARGFSYSSSALNGAVVTSSPYLNAYVVA